jgi:uncharacterized membrane protein required for colicin V production
MVLLIGLFIALICGLLAAKSAGFVASWIKLFNTAVAVYIAVYMTETMVIRSQLVREHACGAVLCAAVLGILVFVILNTICMVIMGELKVEMPRLLDRLGGGAIGFLNGMLLWGFLCLLLAISPAAESSFVMQMLDKDEVEQMWNSSVGTTMTILDFASFQDASHSLPEIVKKVKQAGKPVAGPKPATEEPKEVEEPAADSNLSP